MGARVKVLQNTVATGKDIFEGEIHEVSDSDLAILVAAGRVRPLTEADDEDLKKAILDETGRALKGLNKAPEPETPPAPEPFATESDEDKKKVAKQK